MKALTTRQQEVFDLIRDHISQTGMPPTRAEIAQRLGFRSPNAAEEHLKALARKGAIEIVSGASRGIRLLTEEEQGLPLIGRVAAGEPLLRSSILKATIRSTRRCLSQRRFSCCASVGCR
ncbi:SOS-response repressor and protease LexA [Klebsiella pneumoniae]|uniref:SOS-response repressor and protease LexA n=1 Tax=Klebsiella pneumoniae TaxID=573 RepID=A0A447RX18_KLEPN|nr:SOS-response repressor and protease LexA [Klebsiella pneumoniae]